ncbi:hypothetical protein G7L40_20770 [Paenibacillus polymyxa]|nr:hypothetical protein [Paenibacillus polymyxa]MBE7896072.1 hypothetical protein [Paenibacillus polymyxa]MBG9765972.1 hypothetical protein [Paenibacillus polymyxa]MCC3256609.1 hypothetical protein [Paenibacillus polymyxa]QPK54906.1 hypothetical protein G7035_20825 [Paenibacillus polymyxa]QPK59994.1 hypothetical protein G7L40_20770 [Paenibacillus polymyxa]
MIQNIIQKIFWSKAFEEIREGHRKMCYELGIKDGQDEFDNNNKFYKEFAEAYNNESIILN